MFGRGPVLRSSGQIREEGVCGVQHHQADAVAHAGAQLAGGVVAHEAKLVDGCLHPGGDFRGHLFRPVQHIGYRPDRDAGQGRDVLDAG